MEDLPLGRIAALVPEFAVKVLPLGRTLMMMMMMIYVIKYSTFHHIYWIYGKNNIQGEPELLLQKNMVDIGC